MFSKLSYIVLPLLILISGCGKLLHEAPPKTVNETKLGFETGCLSNALPVMKGFMRGDATPDEVSGVWTCFGNAMEAFQKKVKGSGTNEYTARELTRFFEDYFLKDTKINDRLLLEIMHVKQIFVGGRADRLTREELTRLIVFANKMRGISLRLLPYMKVYSMGWKVSGYRHLDNDVKYFEDSNEAIQEAAKEIAEMIEKNDQGYQLENFVVLLEEMAKVYGESWEFIPKIQKVMPLVEKLKATLAGGDQSIVAPHEWRRFALLGARGYIQYLRYYYFIKDIDENVGGPHLIYFANSVQDLFSYLGDMVRTKPGEKLTKSELLEVLQALHRIFPELNVSEAFITEVMKVKTLLFGGSLTEWVPQDFDRAKSKVSAFRSLIERVWAYVHFYSFKWEPSDLDEAQGQAYFKKAESNLNDFARILGTIFETSYDLQDILLLAEELDKLIPPRSDKGRTLADVARKYLPLVIIYKNILLNDSGTVVQKSHWNDFLDVGVRLYSKALYYNYFLAKRSAYAGDGLNSLHELVYSFSDVLEDILQRKGKRSQAVISYSELDVLVDGLSKAEILPKTWTPEPLKKLVHVLFKRFLTLPEQRLAGREPKGFESGSLSVLKQEFTIWYQNQKLLEEIFPNQKQGLTSAQLQKYLEGLEQNVGVFELRQVFNTTMPMTFDQDHRLNISNQEMTYGSYSGQVANLSRALVRLIVRSYAGDLGRIQNYQGITLEEANVLFNDVRSFFVDIGMLDPKNTTFADNRFREANLFTPQGDGGALMDFREGTHLVLMIISGLELNKAMMARIETLCPTTEGRVWMELKISVDCYLKTYRDEFPRIFTSLPELSAYVSHLSDDQYSLVMMNILKATGWKANLANQIPFADLGLVPHVLQYLETIMHRFDRSKEGILSQEEALSAYPLFAPMLKTISKLASDRLNRAAFAYILRFGKAPKTLKEKLYFVTIWANRESKWHINADRFKVATIFGYIADEVAKKDQEGFAPPSEAIHNLNSTDSH